SVKCRTFICIEYGR
ncbi:Methylthioribulose-1-phosphate dehydratase, partial [Haemophilus influenzae]